MQYLEGRRLRFSARITTFVGGVLTDPDNLKLEIKNVNAGTIETMEYLVDPGFVRDSVGLFHCDYTPPTHASYWYRFSCTGGVEEAAEGNFTVSASHVI